MIAALHALLYLLPGAAFLGLAEAMRRLGIVAVSAARGLEPAWSRRILRISIVLIAATGAALLLIGGLMACVVLR